MDEWYKSDDTEGCLFIAKRETYMCRMKGKCESNVCYLQKGMLVEATRVLPEYFYIHVRDNTDPNWYKTEWRCGSVDLLPVSSYLWHFLLAIPSLQERIRLIRNIPLCRDIVDIQLETKVWYCLDEQQFLTCLACVKFIGPVPELGEGYYFGLDVMVSDDFDGSGFLTAYD